MVDDESDDNNTDTRVFNVDIRYTKIVYYILLECYYNNLFFFFFYEPRVCKYW